MKKPMKSWKRVLYAICFTCIMLIDWVRGTNKWHVWATCINLVGVIMSIIMLSHFSWRKQSWKKYALWGVIWSLGAVIGGFIWKNNPGTVFFYQYVSAAVALGTLGVVALRIVSDKVNIKNVNIGHPLLFGLWVVMSVLMICSPLGDVWPIYYVLIFGMFYMISFSREERTYLWDGLSDGCIVGFFILQIYAYGFRPYDVVRYAGAYANCNINALFYLVTYVMILYRLHSMRYKKREKNEADTKWTRFCRIFFFVLAAGLLNFIFFTMTRTALLMAFVITIVYGIIEFWVLEKKQFKKLLVSGAGMLVCVVLTFPCVYITIRYLPTILHHPVWWEGEYSEKRVHSYDPYNSDKYVSLEEVFDEALGRLALDEENAQITGKTVLVADASENAISNILRSKNESQLLEGDAANSSMRIRLEIYKKYLSHLNLVGHELTDGYFQITENYHAWHAQNVFIQVLFYYGIPAGVCFTVLMLVIGIRGVKKAIAGKNREDVLILFVWLLFVGYGMLESVWYMGQSILFLIYLVPKILIDERNDERYIQRTL